jgi:hypothetical protein
MTTVRDVQSVQEAGNVSRTQDQVIIVASYFNISVLILRMIVCDVVRYDLTLSVQFCVVMYKQTFPRNPWQLLGWNFDESTVL